MTIYIQRTPLITERDRPTKPLRLSSVLLFLRDQRETFLDGLIFECALFVLGS